MLGLPRRRPSAVSLQHVLSLAPITVPIGIPARMSLAIASSFATMRSDAASTRSMSALGVPTPSLSVIARPAMRLAPGALLQQARHNSAVQAEPIESIGRTAVELSQSGHKPGRISAHRSISHQ